MKLILAVLITLFLVVQYQLWFGRNSVRQTFVLKKTIAKQNIENEKIAKQNKGLIRRIMTLKSSHGMVEDLARENMGMVKPGEKYYQFVIKGNSE